MHLLSLDFHMHILACCSLKCLIVLSLFSSFPVPVQSQLLSAYAFVNEGAGD